MKENQPSLLSKFKNKTDKEKRKILSIVSAPIIALGISIIFVGTGGLDNVRKQQGEIRNAFPNSPEVWRYEEAKKQLPQLERKSDLIIVGGIALLVTGFGINLRSAPKEELDRLNSSAR